MDSFKAVAHHYWMIVAAFSQATTAVHPLGQFAQ